MTVDHANRAARMPRAVVTPLLGALLALATFTGAAAYAGDDAAAPIDPAVQSALDYKMPENTCKAPVERIRSEGNSNAQKFERQTRAYKKCIGDYATALTKDLDAIKAAASKGVTPDQAAVIQPKVNALANAIAAASSS